MWLKCGGVGFVILLAFDTETLDIMGYQVSQKEDAAGWIKLLGQVGNCLREAKGFYIDGQLDLVSVLKANFPDKPIQLCVFHKELRIGQIIPLVHVRTEEDRWLKKVFEVILYDDKEIRALRYFLKLKLLKTVNRTKKKQQIYGILNRNFDLLMTHHHYPGLHRTNNILEGFNGNISQKFSVMRGIKKVKNIDRYVKLVLLDYRFRKLTSSKFKDRNHKSPLELAGCRNVAKFHHWLEKHITAR